MLCMLCQTCHTDPISSSCQISRIKQLFQLRIYTSQSLSTRRYVVIAPRQPHAPFRYCLPLLCLLENWAQSLREPFKVCAIHQCRLSTNKHAAWLDVGTVVSRNAVVYCCVPGTAIFGSYFYAANEDWGTWENQMHTHVRDSTEIFLGVMNIRTILVVLCSKYTFIRLHASKIKNNYFVTIQCKICDFLLMTTYVYL